MGCPVHAGSIPCGRVTVVAVAMLLAGCTMCPDPYDYSGPVPNGSSPQNDFRARSRGILPVGAAPVPWPPIVKHEGGAGPDGARIVAHRRTHGARSPEPTLADPSVTSAAGDEAASNVEPTSVLVSVVAEGAAVDASATESTGVPAVFGEDPDEPQPASEGTLATESRRDAHSIDHVEGAAAASATPPVVVELPPFVETPGWRPRQAR